MSFKFGLMTLGIAATLVACGGGGGGGGSNPVVLTSTFNIQSAYVSTLQASSSRGFSVSGTVNGISVTGNGTITDGNLVSTTFEGQSALSQTGVVSMTVSGNGQTIPINTSSIGYYDSNYNFLGQSDSEYAIATTSTVLPTAAKVNDTGTIVTMNVYPTSAKSYIAGTRTVAYSLGPDTANSIILTLITTTRDTGGTTTSTESVRIKMTTSNALTYIDDTYSSTSQSLKITYN